MTGATRGIGKAIAFLYARLGATLAICGRKADALELCAEQLRSLGGGREVHELVARVVRGQRRRAGGTRPAGRALTAARQ